MTMLRRLPARLRLTLAFAAAMAALLAVCGAAIYATVAATLLDELETGLRARAATVEADLNDPGFRLTTPSPELLEPTEEFIQILGLDGHVLDSTPGIRGAAVPPAEAAAVIRPRWFERSVVGVVGTARILVLPARRGPERVRLVVGASMSDRRDALRRIATLLLLGGPVAVLVASGLGWLLTGAAMRPVDRMRAEATAIRVSGLDHRLSVPVADDEFRRLAVTLNDMLARLETAATSERRFLDDASHQLRTPLAALCAELELALRRPRSEAELRSAIASALGEAHRLADTTDALLVSTRAAGRSALNRSDVALQPLLSEAVSQVAERAATADVGITIRAPEDAVHLDAARVRQALDNLLDNALRYAPPDTEVAVRGDVRDGWIEISVADAGPGFAAAQSGGHDGHGLGLAFVTATVAAHGGTVAMDNSATGGARVLLRFPARTGRTS